MKSDIRARIDRKSNDPALPGPKTPEGKAVVRWNSYRHGLTGQTLRISPEEQLVFDRIADGFRLRFQPADEFEIQLVHRLVDDTWRLNSCAALENALFTHGDLCRSNHTSNWDDTVAHIITRALTWQQQGISFERLGRYETHIHHRFHRNLKALEAAQSARRAFEKTIREPTQTNQTKTLDSNIDLFRKIVVSLQSDAVALPVPASGTGVTNPLGTNPRGENLVP